MPFCSGIQRKLLEGKVVWLRVMMFLFISFPLNCLGGQSALVCDGGLSTVLSVDHYYSFAELEEENITRLVDVVRFGAEGDLFGQWVLGGYVFKCGGIRGYDCELLVDRRRKISIDFHGGHGAVDFVPYLYRASAGGYQYEVVLIEAAAERGTSGYYAIVLWDGDVMGCFSTDQGRRYFPATEEYLALNPEADEMYVDPGVFASIFIENGKKVILRLDRAYLYANDESASSDERFVYMQGVFLEDAGE